MSANFEKRMELYNKVDELEKEMPAYMQDYVESQKIGLSPSSLEKRCYQLIAFLKDTAEEHEKDILEVTAQELADNARNYIYNKQYKVTNEGRVKPTSISYRTTYQRFLTMLCDHFLERGLIEFNPLKGIRFPTGTDEKKKVFLTKKEIKQLLDGVRNSGHENAERDYLIYSILVYTGMRISALTNIDLEDIDTDTWKLKVIEKENKVRHFDLSFIKDDLSMWYEERLYECDATDVPLFVSSKGNRCDKDTISKNLKKHSKKYTGKELTAHKLRSSFGVHFYQKTGDIELTRQALGHASIRTTQIYVSNYEATPEEIAEATKQVFQL